MSNRIDHIPDNIEGVMQLMTARKWEKAAIAYAFTKPSAGGRPPKNLDKTVGVSVSELQFPCSIEDFARLKIAGFSSHVTVRKYRAAWQLAMKRRKAKAVKPGDPFVEPDMPWPTEESKETGGGWGRSFKLHSEWIESMIERNPTYGQLEQMERFIQRSLVRIAKAKEAIEKKNN